jgi:hypothetical protein
MIAITDPRLRRRKPSKATEMKLVIREIALREEFSRRLVEENELRCLADVARITDGKLLERLRDAGFCPETLPAFALLPITWAAWASGDVTDREWKLAAEAVFSSELSGNKDAMDLFRSWLDGRPSKALWQLWQDYTRKRLESFSDVERVKAGVELLQLATRVAMASGGFLGFRKTCGGEQKVLDQIKCVYGFDEV